MPVLVIYGLPDDLNGDMMIGELKAEITIRVPELGLKEDQISVFLPADMVENALGEELICFVEGLFAKPERTPEVRRRLADVIRDVLTKFAQLIPQCDLVQVFVKQFNPEKDGYASWYKFDKSAPSPDTT